MSDEAPVLIVKDPTSRPAVTFDRWWLQTLVVRAPSPTDEANATAVLASYASADGSLSGQTVSVEASSLLAESQTNPLAAAAMAAILRYVESLAKTQGLIPVETEPQRG